MYQSKKVPEQSRVEMLADLYSGPLNEIDLTSLAGALMAEAKQDEHEDGSDLNEVVSFHLLHAVMKAEPDFRSRLEEVSMAIGISAAAALWNQVARPVPDGLGRELWRLEFFRWLSESLSGLLSRLRTAIMHEITAAIHRARRITLSLMELTARLKEAIREARKRLVRAIEDHLHAAGEQGRLSAARSVNILLKEWNPVLGSGVCSQCQANAAQGPIPLNEVFQSGHIAPPAHVACRCSLGFS